MKTVEVRNRAPISFFVPRCEQHKRNIMVMTVVLAVLAAGGAAAAGAGRESWGGMREERVKESWDLIIII